MRDNLRYSQFSEKANLDNGNEYIHSRWLAKSSDEAPVPSVSGLTEVGSLDGLSGLVSVLKTRLLGLGAVLVRNWHYREIPYRFPRPRPYRLPGPEAAD